MILHKKAEQFVLIIDHNPDRLDIHHKYLKQYKTYKDVYIKDPDTALVYLNENKLPECFLVLLGHHLKLNYSVMDFIKDMQRIYNYKGYRIRFSLVQKKSELYAIQTKVVFPDSKSLTSLLPNSLAYKKLIAPPQNSELTPKKSKINYAL